MSLCFDFYYTYMLTCTTRKGYMIDNYTVTTSQGPSAHNQTSEDHSHDTNQSARQMTAEEALEANGLNREPVTDINSGDIHSRTEGQPDADK